MDGEARPPQAERIHPQHRVPGEKMAHEMLGGGGMPAPILAEHHKAGLVAPLHQAPLPAERAAARARFPCR